MTGAVKAVNTTLTAEAARKLTEDIKSGLLMTWELIQESIQGRAWKALGYKSFGEWVTVELRPVIAPLTEHMSATGILEAHRAGLSTRAIAAIAQVSQSEVARTVRGESADQGLDSPVATVTGTDGRQYRATAAVKAAQEKRAAAKARHDAKVAEARRLERRDPELSELHRDAYPWSDFYEGFDRTDYLIREITVIGRYALTVVTDLIPLEKGQANRFQPKESDEWPRAKRCEAELHDLDLSIDRLVDFQRRVHEAIEAATEA